MTWDSPIPSAEGEDVFIAQVDFDETGTVMADMALSIMGDDGRRSSPYCQLRPMPANQNAWIEALEEALEDDTYASLDLVDIVYGNDQFRRQLQPGVGPGRQVSRSEVDHGPDDG